LNLRQSEFPMLKLLLVCLGVAMIAGCTRSAPTFEAVVPNAATIERLDKFELTFHLAGTKYTNPFDPAQIDVSAVFVSPSHRVYKVNGFFFQDFSRSGPPEKLTPIGTPAWKVRFTPEEIGTWTYSLHAVDVKTGVGNFGPGTFACVSSQRRGFVQKSSRDPHYFQYEDGTQYIPIGQNLAWGNWGTNNGTYSYDAWLPKMAAQGSNFARYWMWSDFHGIEWKDTGLGNYTARMDQAWRLDHDLEAARRYDIQVMLVLLNHGAVSTQVNPQWADSPYAIANGGPCATPRDFFTNVTAKAYFKRRLRYIVARWGYASNLIWELANEIDNTDGYLTNAGVRADVADWHREMAAYLRSLDPCHLITTSFSRYQDDPAIWRQPDIDFTQFHYYTTSPTAEDAQAAVIKRYRSLFPGKPVFGGEMGFPEGGAYSIANDPRGIQWHNAQWGSLLSGSAGSSALWWWADYIDPQNLYTHYRGLTMFISKLDMPGSQFVPTRPLITTAFRSDLILGGYPEWGFRAEAATFTVNTDGTLTPGADELAAYLYDNKDNAERHNPPTFRVFYPTAGDFKLLTGVPNGQPHLIITVDGQPAYSGNPAADATVTIPISKGQHSISLDNSGTGWVDVTDYLFASVVPSLKIYALQGPTTVAAWVMNRNYNDTQMRDGKTPQAVSGIIHFHGLTHNGIWDVQWQDAETGLVLSRSTARAIGGSLNLPVKQILWDRALKMTFWADRGSYLSNGNSSSQRIAVRPRG
jgi:hypothetical protein